MDYSLFSFNLTVRRSHKSEFDQGINRNSVYDYYCVLYII